MPPVHTIGSWYWIHEMTWHVSTVLLDWNVVPESQSDMSHHHRLVPLDYGASITKRRHMLSPGTTAL